MSKVREEKTWSRPVREPPVDEFDIDRERNIERMSIASGASNDSEASLMESTADEEDDFGLYDLIQPITTEADHAPENAVHHLNDYRNVAKRVMFKDGFDLKLYVDQLHSGWMFQPNDANSSFLPGETHSKKAAAIIMEEFCQSAHLTEKERVDFLEMMQKLLPAANLPCHITAAGNIVNEMNNYTVEDQFRCLMFDCCPCGNCVYAGADSLLDRCKRPACKIGYRFTACKICHLQGHCPHSSIRVAKAVLNYNPFAGIIFDLLSQSGFLLTINYDYKDHENGKVQDVQDGEEYQYHKMDMHRKFQRIGGHTAEQEVIEVSLVLVLYFDGSKVFKRKSTTFIPLVVSILNLPPDIRSELGTGTFTLTICTFKDDCFVKEMVGFYDGVHMSVRGNRYFVQTRVALHGYDTRALQPMQRVHYESKTLISCPLCDSTNTYLNTHFKKLAVYEGHRWLLPLAHYLRLYGQTRKCCPPNQYQHSSLLVDNVGIFASHDEIRPRSLLEAHQHISRRDLTSCSPEYAVGGGRRKEWEAFHKDSLMDPKGQFTWFHSTVRPVFLSEYLYYASCDYRAEHPYHRTSNEEYLTRADAAIENGVHCNGVFGVWVFANLPYSNVSRQICWDPYHSCYNCAKYTIDTWKGERTVCQDCIAYEKQRGGHPDLYQPKISANSSKKRKFKEESDDASTPQEECRPSYTLRPVTQSKIEEFVDMIYIPKGHREHYQVKKLFSCSGELHGHAKIQVMTVLMEFIMWLVAQYEHGYPSAYIAFHLMLAHDLVFLQRHVFTTVDIDFLHKLIIETVATRNGLYPPTESKLIWHQLVDIVPFIRLFGPIRGWWTLPMERALSKIKKNVPIGGSSYYITTFRRQMMFEQHALRKGYAFTADKMNSNVRNKGTVLDRLENKGTIFITDKGLHFSDKTIFLRQHSRAEVSLKDVEYNALLLQLVEEIQRLSNGDEGIMITNSCLYRLYECCKTHYRNKLSKIPPSQFFKWMETAEQIKLKVIACEVSRLPVQAILREIYEGNVFEADMRQLKKYWLQKAKVVNPYQKACIFGIEFSSRGYVYREEDEPVRRGLNEGWNAGEQFYFPIKSCNLLRYNLSKNEYSSWFALVDPVSVDENKTESNAPRVGQFNFFFRVMIRKGVTSDPLIHGIPLGSAVFRNASRVSVHVASRGVSSNIMTKMLTVDASKNEAFCYSQRFVSLSLVQATAFGVGFMSQKDGHTFPVSTELISSTPNLLRKLFLIPLYPSRADSVFFSQGKTNDLYHNPSLDK